MKTPIMHMYNFDRTARDGCRVMCGRDTRDVVWTGGWSEKNKRVPITCKACKKAMKRRERARTESMAAVL